jgi:hypothetical protein
MIKQIVSAAFALGVVTAASAGSILPTSAYFDGYCDGIKDITVDDNGMATGTWDNSTCGWFDAAMTGVSGHHLGNTKGRAASFTGYQKDFDMTATFVLTKSMKWSVYVVGLGLFNHGTWTEGTMPPGSRAHLPMSTAAK